MLSRFDCFAGCEFEPQGTLVSCSGVCVHHAVQSPHLRSFAMWREVLFKSGLLAASKRHKSHTKLDHTSCSRPSQHRTIDYNSCQIERLSIELHCRYKHRLQTQRVHTYIHTYLQKYMHNIMHTSMHPGIQYMPVDVGIQMFCIYVYAGSSIHLYATHLHLGV